MHDRRPFILFALFFLGATPAGCSSGDGDRQPAPGPTCSSTDGQTACSGTFCAANQYCDHVLCNAGCQSSANCSSGMFCDKAGTTVVGEAGVCRPCGAAPVDAGTIAPPSCEDVSGNYLLRNRSGNPPVCGMLPVPSDAVSVTQSGTTARWTHADGDGVEQLWACEHDSTACRCDGTFTLEGVTGDVSWRPAEGYITASAMGVECDFDALRQ